MMKKQEGITNKKCSGHQRGSDEETDTPWYIIPINFKNIKKLLVVAFFIFLLMSSVLRYPNKRREELDREGVNVEAVVFYSKYWHPKQGAYRHLKVYFHLYGKYEEQRVYIYSHNYAPVPEVAVGDTIYIRVVPGKIDNNMYLSKKTHRIP